MNPRLGFYSFSGQYITKDEGHLTLIDIVTSLSRIDRYAGGAKVPFPVLLHSLAVADLVPVSLEIYGLLHDMTDAIFGDIPKPFKIPEMLVLQHVMHDRFLSYFGLVPLSIEDEHLVKVADTSIFIAEANLFGPPGLAKGLGPVDDKALALVTKYLNFDLNLAKDLFIQRMKTNGQ